MAITPNTLHSYFQQYGWEFTPTDDPNVIVSGYADGDQNQAFAVVISDTLLTFTCPIVAIPYNEGLTQKLLRLNFDLPAAKISLDEALTLILSVELPADGFGYGAFMFALDALMQGIDQVKTAFLPTSALTEKPE